jgi:hypothetical protein
MADPERLRTRRGVALGLKGSWLGVVKICDRSRILIDGAMGGRPMVPLGPCEGEGWGGKARGKVLSSDGELGGWRYVAVPRLCLEAGGGVRAMAGRQLGKAMMGRGFQG